jgi:hypothetical protein
MWPLELKEMELLGLRANSFREIMLYYFASPWRFDANTTILRPKRALGNRIKYLMLPSLLVEFFLTQH